MTLKERTTRMFLNFKQSKEGKIKKVDLRKQLQLVKNLATKTVSSVATFAKQNPDVVLYGTLLIITSVASIFSPKIDYMETHWNNGRKQVYYRRPTIH